VGDVRYGSDQVARGVMDMVRERGRRIPDDVAVMGFDNWEVLATDARPPLTSVDMNLEELSSAVRSNLGSPPGTGSASTPPLGAPSSAANTARAAARPTRT
jgi:Periplasmic binding protein-like domain